MTSPMQEISLLKPSSATDDITTKITSSTAKILRYDSDLTETYLSELLDLLPDAEQVRCALLIAFLQLSDSLLICRKESLTFTEVLQLKN